MIDSKYYEDFDDFLEKNPDIDPAWRPLIEPVYQDTEIMFFNFIMGYCL